ncbi:MAG: hypothetical protein QOI47_2649, partial [Actinomycetota bacterium]|nr:hypothetical protein [Actinomycetota bacterium]
MLRTLRALLVVALVALLTVGTAGAAGADTASRDGHRGSDVPAAVASNNRRQVLLHRRWPAGGVPGSMLVTAATPAEAIRIASAESGTVVGAKTVVLHVSPGTEAAVAGRIAGRYRAVGIEPDRVRAPAAVPNDPRFPAQWSHRLTNITSAWDHTTGSAAVKVAVLDTGVDARHEDLANVISQVDLSSGHVVTRTNLPVDNDSCNVGHGTFVAGVIGATGNNGTGIAGVAWTVSIVDVALTSAASRCGILDSAIIAGIDYAVKTAHADVINLSLGGVA